MTEESSAEQAAGSEINANQLEDLIGRMPELSANSHAVLEAARELTDTFDLADDFFEDSTRNLFLLLLSQRLVRARSSPDLASGQRVREEGFIQMAVPLLALDKSDKYLSLKEQIDTYPLPSPESQRQIYDEYTNQELTEKLKQAIVAGLLDDVKQRLGIHGETRPFELRVLEVGDVYTVSGTEPKKPDHEYSYPPTPEWQRYDAEYEIYKKHLQQLMANGENFSRKLGQRPDALPTAWTVNMDGEIYLGLPSPVARKILYPEQFDVEVYDDAQRARDKATLEHEFVHTQSPLMLDGEPFFGIALEERRAEYFSGDKMGYQDIKQLMIDIENVTGFNFKVWLEEHRQTDQAEAYIDLMNKLGATAALEIALAVPKSYQLESRPLQKRIAGYLGTPDELVKRFYDQAVAKGEEAKIKDRIESMVKGWMDRGVDIELIADIRPGMFGLSFMTDKYLQKYRELSAK